MTADAEGTRLWKLTREFYENRQFAPAWIEDSEPKREMADFIKALWGADQEGLDPQLYNVSLIDHRMRQASKGFITKKGFEPKQAGTLDVWLTYLYMKYSSDLADGLSDLAHADPKWRIKPEKFEPRARLVRELEADAVVEIADDGGGDHSADVGGQDDAGLLDGGGHEPGGFRLLDDTAQVRQAGLAAAGHADGLLDRHESTVEHARAREPVDQSDQRLLEPGERLHLAGGEQLERGLAARRRHQLRRRQVAAEEQLVVRARGGRHPHAGPVDIGHRAQR